MSEAIPFSAVPSAVLGMEVQVPRDKMQELRRNGTLYEVINEAMGAGMSAHILNKHKGDVEVAALDGEMSTAGRSYRLEIVTFTRKQWLAHTDEWVKLEAERDSLKAQLESMQATKQ